MNETLICSHVCISSDRVRGSSNVVMHFAGYTIGYTHASSKGGWTQKGGINPNGNPRGAEAW